MTELESPTTVNQTPESLSDYRAPPDLLHGRRVLVTGAADGIGRAVARGFAAHGASVAILDKKRRKLETLYDEIIAAGSPEPVIIVQNLLELDAGTARGIALGLEHDFGGLEGLAHCAAEFGGLTPLHNVTAERWARTLQANLTAPFLLTAAVLPLLKSAADTSIIFSSSSTARAGKAFWGSYGVAGAGIESLAQIWSQELEAHTRVRVNTLDPGPVRTRLRGLAYPGEDASQLPAPEDVVPAYLYLMGPDSLTVTGCALSVRLNP